MVPGSRVIFGRAPRYMNILQDPTQSAPLRNFRSASYMLHLCMEVLPSRLIVGGAETIFFFKQKTAYDLMPSLVGSEMCIRDRLYTFFNPQGSDWICVVNLFKSVQLYFVMKELGWRDKTV